MQTSSLVPPTASMILKAYVCRFSPVNEEIQKEFYIEKHGLADWLKTCFCNF